MIPYAFGKLKLPTALIEVGCNLNSQCKFVLECFDLFLDTVTCLVPLILGDFPRKCQIMLVWLQVTCRPTGASAAVSLAQNTSLTLPLASGACPVMLTPSPSPPFNRRSWSVSFSPGQSRSVTATWQVKHQRRFQLLTTSRRFGRLRRDCVSALRCLEGDAARVACD